MSERRTSVQKPTEELLSEVVQRLVSELAPRRVYLFGSHVYGQPHEGSDVDLMIVVDRPEQLSVDYLKRAYRCLRRTFVPFELHFRTQARFDRRRLVRTSIEHTIATKGKLLYAA